MKATELRKVIREEIAKVLKESQIQEGMINQAIRPALSGDLKAAVEELEKSLTKAGLTLTKPVADELAYIIIDIKDVAYQEGLDDKGLYL